MGKTIKLCFVICGIRFGGMEKQALEIIRGLADKGYKISLITFKIDPKLCSSIPEKVHLVLVKRKSKFDLSPMNKINKIIKKNNIGLVYCFDSLAVFFSIYATKKNRIPLINGAIRDAGVNKGIEYLFTKLLLSLSQKIVANSKAGLKYYKIKNGEVIYNSIDTNRFKKNISKSKSIVMNANFSDYKDHKTFFSAIQELVECNKIDKVVLIGAGKNLDYWKSIASNWENQHIIQFMGHVNNVEEIISECKIGVLCSTEKYKEGISNSILEYMGTGLIAVGSNIGGTSEIIDEGINGFLFEVENSLELKRKIIYCLDEMDDHKHSQITDSARDTLIEKFSFEQNNLKVEKVIKEVYEKQNKSKSK